MGGVHPGVGSGGSTRLPGGILKPTLGGSPTSLPQAKQAKATHPPLMSDLPVKGVSHLPLALLGAGLRSPHQPAALSMAPELRGPGGHPLGPAGF